MCDTHTVPTIANNCWILVACGYFFVLYCIEVLCSGVLYCTVTVLYLIVLLYMYYGIGKRGRRDLKPFEHVNGQLYDLTENVTHF